MPYSANDDLRSVLAQHMNDWEIRDRGERLEVSGWLKSSGVEVRVSGVRSHVVGVVDALVRALIALDRV